jgi:hypothetical protein
VVLDTATSVTATSLTLNWSRNEDTDFAAYFVYRDTSPGVTDQALQMARITDPFQTFFDDSAINTVANIYYYRVYVEDKAENRSRSNEITTGP